MRPISIINHNTIIPKNTGRFRETFNTIVLLKNRVYKITSITCNIDIISPWKIRKMNYVRMVNTRGQSIIYPIGNGYYSITYLCAVLAYYIVINANNHAYVILNTCKTIDFTDAPDIANIFRMEHKLYNADGIVYITEPYDLTNVHSVIRVYSSIMKQSFGIKTSFIDNLISVSIRLNNIITIDNLKIDAIDQSNLDSIE